MDGIFVESNIIGGARLSEHGEHLQSSSETSRHRGLHPVPKDSLLSS
jgi:hypothetical protein